MKVNILGVKVDDVSMDEVLAQIEEWLKKPGKHYIVTPNPEMIVAAQKDLQFKKILNDADLSIPDGVGLKLSGKVKHTVAGTDLMEKLIKLSAEKGFVTSFLGGRDEVAEKCAERLLKKHPKLKIGFAESGGEVNKEGNMSIANRLQAIARKEEDGRLKTTDILFVAFGHGKQEKWIADNLPKVPVKVMVTVGGAFDYLSGNIPRAPKWLREIGLEWLFRLAVQPWRIKRQLVLLKYLWLLFLS